MHASSHIMFAPEEVLTIITNYAVAMMLYLEFLVNELHSKVLFCLQPDEDLQGHEESDLH